MSDTPTPEGVSFLLNIYRNAPYQSDAKPPFFTGDLCLRDGVQRITDMGERKIEDDEILVWDGEYFVPLITASKREYKVHVET